jgi:hypothetical protein
MQKNKNKEGGEEEEDEVKHNRSQLVRAEKQSGCYVVGGMQTRSADGLRLKEALSSSI